jgi:hypothetical protein
MKWKIKAMFQTTNQNGVLPWDFNGSEKRDDLWLSN